MCQIHQNNLHQFICFNDYFSRFAISFLIWLLVRIPPHVFVPWKSILSRDLPIYLWTSVSRLRHDCILRPLLTIRSAAPRTLTIPRWPSYVVISALSFLDEGLQRIKQYIPLIWKLMGIKHNFCMNDETKLKKSLSVLWRQNHLCSNLIVWSVRCGTPTTIPQWSLKVEFDIHECIHSWSLGDTC